MTTGSYSVIHVVGARPNFMKAAPLVLEFAQRSKIAQKVVHTGQHYDPLMSDVFFQQLGIRHPDVNLGVGSGSHAEQTAEVMVRFEKVVREKRPDAVVVYGDINSTVAASLVCAKSGIPVIHVEAGLRSGDLTMPEEINRLVTDRLASLHLTPSSDGDENLRKEGIGEQSIKLVGNLMIDTLVRLLPQVRAPQIDGLEGPCALVTLHRPSNVDNPERLAALVVALGKISGRIPVVFPVHPRTRARLKEHGIDPSVYPAMHIADPMGYLEFLYLQQHAAVVITDSGGIQEETTYLGVPCLTMRENTERPITVAVGTNQLIGNNLLRLHSEVELVVSNRGKKGHIPYLWDGHAAVRAADRIIEFLGGQCSASMIA